MTGRVIALDLGDRRIGIAVCDAGRLVATPYETVRRVGDRPAEHDQIAKLVDDVEAVAVVVGLPISLDGSDGPAARKARSEIRALRKRFEPEIEVFEQDERNSTLTAQDSLRVQGVKSKNQRDVVDQLAAAVILQNWIDSNR